jgi:hypothetical protein
MVSRMISHIPLLYVRPARRDRDAIVFDGDF